MKQIISVRSNVFYQQEKNEDQFQLKPMMELVIIHMDGKEYKLNNSELEGVNKIVESRMLVSPELLQNLITELQLHQKTLNGIRDNADKINSLVKYINETTHEQTTTTTTI